MSSSEAFRLSVVENVQRESLTPLEEAESYKDMVTEGMTQTDIGRLVGKTQSYVAQKLRLLKMPDPLKALIAQGALSEGHIRQLLRFEKLYPPNKRFRGQGHPWKFKREDRYLAAVFNAIRPEDNPPAPLWTYPLAQIEDCAHMASVFDSADALFSQYNEEGSLPQPVVSAWWWGCAAIIGDIPVAGLAKHIDLWVERFDSALVYVHSCADKPTFRGEDDIKLLWSYKADLRHGSCLPVTDADFQFLHDSGRLDRFLSHSEWVFPSSLQQWGLEHKNQREQLERDTRAYARASTN